MRKCWGFYDNGYYKVGCNGATMYLYDAEDRELAKFRDISYAYRGAFKPGSNIFLLRSTDGRLAVYDCDQRKLLIKLRFSGVDHSQDDGFCFSPDGGYFLNIERTGPSAATRLTIYETQTFSPVKRLFEGETTLSLSAIEYNPSRAQYHVLFFTWDDRGVYSQGYIARLKDGQLVNKQPIDGKAYVFLQSYKSLQLSNFTEKAMEWSGLHYAGYTNDEIRNLKDRNIDLVSFPAIAGEVLK